MAETIAQSGTTAYRPPGLLHPEVAFAAWLL
jgi:hypothetical protein